MSQVNYKNEEMKETDYSDIFSKLLRLYYKINIVDYIFLSNNFN